MKKLIGITCLLCIMASVGNLFASSEDERIRALESRIQALENTNITRGTNIASAVSQTERIQAEFAGVRGAVDSNSHRIGALNAQMQNLYQELERRIQSMEDQLRIIQSTLKKNLSDSSSKAASEYLAFQDATEAMTATDYLKAAASFQSFIDKYPKSRWAPEAQYKTAECYFYARDYQQSIKQFQVFIERNPRSKRVADAMIMQGSAFVELGMIEEAKAFFNKVGQDYPKSNAAKQAKAKLEMIDSRGTMTARNHVSSTPAAAAIEYPSETVQQQRQRNKTQIQQRANPPAPTAAPQTPQQAPKPKQDRSYMEF